MGGGLISYGDALKAFRRGVHQFPGVWKALVICANNHQRNFAFSEAMNILNAGSVPVERGNLTTMCIKTAKGGEIHFMLTERGVRERLAGLEAPQIIKLVGEIPPDLETRLATINRSAYVDQKYCRVDEATL